MSKKNTPNKGKGKSKSQAQSQPVGFSLRSKINEFREFLEQSKFEMKKVTYPSQKQTLTTCGSVLFIVAVIALFLGIVDLILTQIMETFLS